MDPLGRLKTERSLLPGAWRSAVSCRPAPGSHYRQNSLRHRSWCSSSSRTGETGFEEETAAPAGRSVRLFVNLAGVVLVIQGGKWRVNRGWGGWGGVLITSTPLYQLGISSMVSRFKDQGYMEFSHLIQGQCFLFKSEASSRYIMQSRHALVRQLCFHLCFQLYLADPCKPMGCAALKTPFSFIY